MFKVKATIVSTTSSEILNFFQSKLVWWYSITRQGRTPWEDFLAFTQGVRQRIWLERLWTRLLPLLAIPISKAGVNLLTLALTVPIKKMWKEHCFCNEYACLLSFLVNGSSVLFLYPFVLVMMSTLHVRQIKCDWLLTLESKKQISLWHVYLYIWFRPS